MLNIGVAGDRHVGGQVCCEVTSWSITSTTTKNIFTVTLADGQRDYSDLATQLVNAGHRLTLFREEELNLETAFMALTKGITS